LRNARKIRAALERKRKALQPKPVEERRISLKEFVRDRKEKTRRSVFVPKYAHRSSNDQINRPNPGDNRDITPRIDRLKYTGGNLIGIAVMHKSCLVPIFNQAEAESVAKMRRN